MRSTLFLGCLLWAAVCVQSITRVEHPSAIKKRSPQLQIYQPPQNQSQQFQWVKENNQWVRRDGTRLPGYSQANVPYNQTRNQWNTPSSNSQPGGVNSWNNAQRPGNQSAVGWGQQQRPLTPQLPSQQRPLTPQLPSQQGPQQIPQSPSQQVPRRQNSTSQGGLAWNPDADRALTQDLPRTTPRPVYTTPVPVLPQTPPPAVRPPVATPPGQAPFGSGIGGQQRPSGSRGTWNPDASLTYGGVGRPQPPPQNNKPPINPNAGRGGSNPWGGIFSRLW